MSDDFHDPELRAASDTANHTWSDLLRQIDSACDGAPDALLGAVHSMWTFRNQALALLANPLVDHDGRHAGPTFDWVAA